MKNTRWNRRLAKLTTGAILTGFALGPCLPDNFFANSARNVAVTITDSLLATAIAPFLDALGVIGGNTDTTTTGN